MNVDVYAVCYNEELFLPYFLRHYERFARSITVFDNNSTDASPEIIKNHPLCSFIPFNALNGFIREELTFIKNECWKGSDADWVVVCDVDELLYYPNIKYLFENLQGRYSVWQPQAYTMLTQDEPYHDGQVWEIYDEGVRTPFYDKCIVFDPKEVIMNYTDNGHGCNPQPEVAIFNDSDLRLLHYRCMGLQYTQERFKILKERIGKREKWADYSNPQKFFQQFFRHKRPCVPPLDNKQLIHINWIDENVSLES